MRRLPNGTRLSARIVETEAYEEDDPASHSFRGETPRNAVMFGQAGHLYVYFTYGMHFCMNVVTGRVGAGAAVLLRAAEPLEGLPQMRSMRGREAPQELCSGPANLSRALGVDRRLDGADLVRGREVWIEEGAPEAPGRVVAGPRVGIRVGVDRPWRFRVRGGAFGSPARPRPRVSRSASSGPPTP